MSVTHHRKVQPGPTSTQQADKQGDSLLEKEEGAGFGLITSEVLYGFIFKIQKQTFQSLYETRTSTKKCFSNSKEALVSP